jgi:hypothetical protein
MELDGPEIRRKRQTDAADFVALARRGHGFVLGKARSVAAAVPAAAVHIAAVLAVAVTVTAAVPAAAPSTFSLHLAAVAAAF